MFGGAEVAVKCIAMESLETENIRDHCYELLVAHELQHPSIVHFHGFSVSPPNLYLTMELCQATDECMISHVR